MYVLVRRDLAAPSIAVQGTHAVLALSRLIPIPKNEFVVYCSVHNEEQLLRWEYRSSQSRIVYSCFREPDLGGSLTAIAAGPVCGSARRFFRSLQVYKEI